MIKIWKNKHQNITRDYKQIVEEQRKIIKQQDEKIKKLETNLESLKEASKHNEEFANYYQFYVKDRKKYNLVINELDRILTKFNC